MSKKGATGDFFFSFLQKNFSPKKWTIFPFQTKKNGGGGGGGGNKNCSGPTGHSYGHPLDRKQTFFCGQPEYCSVHSSLHIKYNHLRTDLVLLILVLELELEGDIE